MIYSIVNTWSYGPDPWDFFIAFDLNQCNPTGKQGILPLNANLATSRKMLKVIKTEANYETAQPL
jgi:hypothetical protein